MEDITKYTELITKVIQRLERIWERGEGDLNVEVRNDNNKKRAKITGGETERVG
uniref:Uncharacterized protein n=1 Tax=viral metagenome TaxID=1070528 RepID=A0A6H1ZRY5_9ZZZZ